MTVTALFENVKLFIYWLLKSQIKHHWELLNKTEKSY